MGKAKNIGVRQCSIDGQDLSGISIHFYSYGKNMMKMLKTLLLGKRELLWSIKGIVLTVMAFIIIYVCDILHGLMFFVMH